MGNKKVYLGSAILLLAAAAIGAGLWLQHRAEQKREERKNAIYGYWMTENPMTDLVVCIKIAPDELKLSNMSMNPANSSVADEVVASINEDGKVTAEAILPNKTKHVFTLADDPTRMFYTPSPELSPVTLKKISQKEYNDYWGPLDLTEWSKLKYFVNKDYTLLIMTMAISPSKILFAQLPKNKTKRSLGGEYDAWTCKKEIAVFPKGSFPLPLSILDKNTIRLLDGEILHEVTPETYHANKAKILEIYKYNNNNDLKKLQKTELLLDGKFSRS